MNYTINESVILAWNETIDFSNYTNTQTMQLSYLINHYCGQWQSIISDVHYFYATLIFIMYGCRIIKKFWNPRIYKEIKIDNALFKKFHWELGIFDIKLFDYIEEILTGIIIVRIMSIWFYMISIKFGW